MESKLCNMNNSTLFLSQRTHQAWAHSWRAPSRWGRFLGRRLSHCPHRGLGRGERSQSQADQKEEECRGKEEGQQWRSWSQREAQEEDLLALRLLRGGLPHQRGPEETPRRSPRGVPRQMRAVWYQVLQSCWPTGKTIALSNKFFTHQSISIRTSTLFSPIPRICELVHVICLIGISGP